MALGILRGGLLAASGLLVFSGAGEAAQIHQTPHMNVRGVSQKNSDRGLTVLYDQTNNPSGQGTFSQNFGNSNSSAAADDFTVPDGTHWIVEEVDVPGIYFNGSGPSPTVQVTFYKNKHHRPAAVISSAAIVPSDNFGSFKLNVGHVKLKPGHYWVSVVANMDFAEGGEWAWENQTTGTVEGDPSVWESTGDAHCSTWGTQQQCFGSALGDQMFTLKGKAR